MFKKLIPEPEWPTIATTWPGFTSKSNLSNTFFETILFKFVRFKVDLFLDLLFRFDLDRQMRHFQTRFDHLVCSILIQHHLQVLMNSIS